MVPVGKNPKDWLDRFGTTLKTVMDEQADSRAMSEALWNQYAQECRRHGVVPKVPNGRRVTNAGVLQKP